MRLTAPLLLLLSAGVSAAAPPVVPKAPVLCKVGDRPAVVRVEVPKDAEFQAAPAFPPESASINVLPVVARDDFVNGSEVNAVLGGQVFQSQSSGRVGFPNRTGIGFGDFGLSVPGTSGLRAVPVAVGRVSLAGVPSEVADGVVLGVAINVTTLHAGRAWADENLQDKAVDANANLRGEEADLEVFQSLVRVHRDQFHSPPFGAEPCDVPASSGHAAAASTRPNRTVGANPVSGVPGNVFVLNCRLNISHDVPSCQGAWWSGPAGVTSTRSARFHFTARNRENLCD